MTMGIDFTLKEIDIRGEAIQLQIWDTSGQPSFQILRKKCYEDSQDQRSYPNAVDFSEKHTTGQYFKFQSLCPIWV